MRVMRLDQIGQLFLSMLLLMAAGCSGERGREPAPEVKQAAQDAETARDSLPAGGEITIRVAGVPLQVRIGETPEEKQRGLMFTERLPPDQGMLFVFQQEDRLAFWMKDTPIPLDIAFIDARRRILEIRKMKPLETTVYLSRQPALYALEVNAGWFQENGIKVGDEVEF